MAQEGRLADERRAGEKTKRRKAEKQIWRIRRTVSVCVACACMRLLRVLRAPTVLLNLSPLARCLLAFIYLDYVCMS